MSLKANLVQDIKDSMDGFIQACLSIFGRNPRFDLSVFCIEKGNPLDCQKLASQRYAAEDFCGKQFQAKLKQEQFCAGHNIINEIRSYGNFFPDFYHAFLRKTCQELSQDRNEIFFPLPRYTFNSHIYLPIFSIDLSWLIDHQNTTPAGHEESGTFFFIVLDTIRRFLSEETKISGEGLNIDGSQPPRLHTMAAAAFLGKITGNQNFYNYINTIASLKYEKKDSTAQIALCRQAAKLPLLVRFEVPIPVKENRKVRKLLAATGEKHCLVCSNGEYLEGIANIKDMQNQKNVPVHFIYLLKHLTWELVRDGKLLLRYATGNISTSRHEMKNQEILPYIIKRLNIGEPEAVRVLALIRKAQATNHGSTLVFSSSAKEEARRLQQDGFLVEPFMLDPDDMIFFTVMDGALLLDIGCRCHALGVILDGESARFSDTSRGARFNSALRYHEKRCYDNLLIVVVSDDGMVDLIPAPDEEGV